ncbi:MAG: hypothetical protein WDA75_10235 [Candidatus Latescibacterota bacterium]|jgi:hypothetical protein
MRPDEEMCCEALIELLRGRGVPARCIAGPDPPDARLLTAEGEFAVEITSIHGVADLDGKDATWTQLGKELHRFGVEVCAEVSRRVVVPGVFAVHFRPTPLLKQMKAGIVDALAQHFSGDDRGQASSHVRSEAMNVQVSRVRPDGSDLLPWVLPAGSLVGPLPYQLESLLLRAVQEKTRKLSAITVPKILVIHDLYLFQGTSEEWRDSLAGATGPFAAVVRVQRRVAELICGALPAS